MKTTGQRSNIFWSVICVAATAYLLYSTGGCEHFPEFPHFGRGSAESPVSLNPSEIAKITGGGNPYQGSFYTQLYNGTDWSVTRIDVTLTNKKTSSERRFLLSPPSTKLDLDTMKQVPTKVEPMRPFSKGTFQADIGDFLNGAKEGEWTWSITSAFGFRE